MSQPAANCPNCGAPVQFRWSGAVQTTCAFCRSILVRHDVDLEKVGEVADLPADSSPIQIGTEGVAGNRSFTVVGRILYEYEQGGWNEWHLILNDGSSAWLSDAQNEFELSALVANPGPLPASERLTVQQGFLWNGVRYQVTSLTTAHYRGVEGELPFEYWDKADVLFADLRTVDGRFATIDYSETPPLLFMGQSVEFADLHLKKLREPAAAIAPAVKAAGLNCPNCGGALTIRAQEHTITVACPKCLSILDAKDPNLQILQKAEAKERIAPLIALGTRGKLRGDVYEVIGFQVRTIEVDGLPDSWAEYLLFHPLQGFRYLTEYNGHWNDVKTIQSLPELTRRGNKPAVKLLGTTYVQFDRATATTTYVLGEFPWRVRVGDRAEVKDYIFVPHILSSETTESETVWSLGEYVTGARVWEAFQLPGQPPAARGLFANQPSPYAGQIGGVWKVCLNLFSAMIAFAILVYLFAGQQELFRHQYSFSPGSRGEASFVTDSFEVTGHPANVEVAIQTDLYNNWAYFSFALINEATGQGYDFGREVSYYTGRDSDGTWTEGSARDRAIIPAVEPGRYYLRVEPEMSPQASSMVYTLRVRRGVPSASFFWIAAALLVIPPALATWRAISFEQRRWQQSDFAPASSNGGDDD